MPRKPPRSYHNKVGTKPRTGKSAPPRTVERKRMMGLYNKILYQVCSKMGRKITSSSELEQALVKFGLSPCEVGPLSMYENRKNGGKAPKYGIYNTMYEAPGQHWFCCYENYKYDPLGDDQSDTQEQPDNTDDCGQRCIAYLLMCKKNGGAIRM